MLIKLTILKQGITIDGKTIDISTIIDSTDEEYVEPEWGFPKGRHNNQEKDLLCALREFEEETGYSRLSVTIIHNLMPFEEIFTGSNYKSYKHKYYVAFMEDCNNKSASYQDTEVSKIEWKTYKDTMDLIRPYNLEKKEVLTRVDTLLENNKLYNVM